MQGQKNDAQIPRMTGAIGRRWRQMPELAPLPARLMPPHKREAKAGPAGLTARHGRLAREFRGELTLCLSH